MRLSQSVVVTPGGIGTCLELFFSWQLVQVKHLEPRPIVLVGKDFWTGLVTWLKEQPLGHALMSAPDFDYIHIVDTPEEAFETISKPKTRPIPSKRHTQENSFRVCKPYNTRLPNSRARF